MKSINPRKLFIWIISIVGIIGIAVFAYAIYTENKELTYISGVFTFVMAVLRELIALILRDDKTKTEVNTTPADMPANNVPGRFQYFTGRKKDLAWIHNEFNSARVLVITGLGGIGKSEIAKEYAVENRKDYDLIWWIDAETENNIRSGYVNFAQEHGLAKDKKADDDKIREVKKWMKNNDRWLFIFDNAEKETTVKKYFPDSNTGNILVTSRYALWEEYKPHEIKELDREDACNFLREYTRQENDAGLEELVVELGCLPLALRHAAAYMKRNKTPYAEYLKELRKDQSTEFDDLPATKIVAKTLEKSFRRIKKISSIQLIYLFAFLAPEKINRQWFISASKKLPWPLRKAVKSKSTYNKIIAELTAYSLITLDYDGNFSLHRLVQEVIRDSLKKEEARWRRICIDILNELRYFDFSTAESRDLFRILATHIVSVTAGINDADATEEAAQFYHFLGWGFYELADYSQALIWHEKALAVREKVLGKAHPDTATTYNEIARVYIEQDDCDHALEFNNKALAIYEKVLGKEHPDTATTYNNIAVVYNNKGDYDHALEFNTKALGIYEKALGKEHPDTATTYNNIATVYIDKGDYDKALDFYTNALAIWEKALGIEHPLTATVYNNIATVYRHKSDYDLALEYYKKSFSIRKKILGVDHLFTKQTLNNMTGAYKASRNPEPFEAWLKKNLSESQ